MKKSTALVKAYGYYCGEHLLDLLPSALLPTTYAVDWSTRYSWILEFFQPAGVHCAALNNFNTVQQERANLTSGPELKSESYTCGHGKGAIWRELKVSAPTDKSETLTKLIKSQQQQ